MNEADPNSRGDSVDLKDAARFWERQRVWYNGVLLAVIVLWVVLTWPHFRPAMNFMALGKMTVLAVLANLCYCAGYAMEGFIQPLVPRAYWRRLRWGVWVGGMLLAILLSNYWIADEIFPDFNQERGAAMLGAVEISRGGTGAASNMNFPAPVAVVGFLAACIGLFVGAAAGVIFWFARKPRFARVAGTTIGVGAVIYFGVLLGFSAGSHSNTLARGQEKYFCEIDCHLAYSVVDVKVQGDGAVNHYIVTMRTRFDETTTSPDRPKDVTLTPSPREVRIVDGAGREYAMVSSAGTSLMTRLRPGESYTTQLEFQVPKDSSELRLLIRTVPGWPDHFVIGDENSLMHGKTYFAL
ncbi:MAG TPA: hypothetical protein VE377_01800 [Candidatus Dormibacteraeota bacterium]|nr:hypothetical protein [Candidatus Dormibacteraeota bacterium]